MIDGMTVQARSRGALVTSVYMVVACDKLAEIGENETDYGCK
jgi:hypothetical protein